jgi:hypothetical protein
MPTIFLSYSSKDNFHAELISTKLSAAGLTVWTDQRQLRAGENWRQGIEKGIADSFAVIVALTKNSAQSSYVTFEWAYAFGKGKEVIPVKLEDCEIHPKLAAIQQLNFSNSGPLPWDALIERIQEIQTDTKPDEAAANNVTSSSAPASDDTYAKAILLYLNQRCIQMASFDRLRSKINNDLTDKHFNEIIVRNPTVFRHATLTGKKLGIAKLVP